MLRLRPFGQFKRDYKLAIRRKFKISVLDEVIDTLRKELPLAPKYRDHALTGNYAGYRECHIEPDWLLIYAIQEDVLALARTGTHHDIFGN